MNFEEMCRRHEHAEQVAQKAQREHMTCMGILLGLLVILGTVGMLCQ